MRHAEANHQRALFAWARLTEGAHPELALLYSIPMGGRRNPREAALLKAEGARAGIPDLCLPVPRGRWHALYIELKRPAAHDAPRGRATPAQTWWLDRLADAGNRALVAYGWDQARDEILAYLTLPA